MTWLQSILPEKVNQLVYVSEVVVIFSTVNSKIKFRDKILVAYYSALD